ncbi:MFS transporter [Phyllobacterium sp. A18/5-2]|uniref:MFS transporter n=1 Tax=Phyllobacterium sp. A18/5-2 TaxID=2978392 RepID=UPI0039659B8B
MALSALLILSGIIVAFAPTYPVLMAGRALLGIAIGGFWSTAVIMRLLPERAVPRGLAMLNAGNAIAATVSAPLGSLLGDHIGWRGAFFFVVPPSRPGLAVDEHAVASPAAPSRPGNVFRLLGRRQILLSMTAILLLFMGQFWLFTYLRPYCRTLPAIRCGTGLSGSPTAVIREPKRRHSQTKGSNQA